MFSVFCDKFVEVVLVSRAAIGGSAMFSVDLFFVWASFLIVVVAVYAVQLYCTALCVVMKVTTQGAMILCGLAG